MISSPSLCPLFPSTIHDCILTRETEDESSARRDHHRRIYGNIDMQLNSSRLPLNPDHIATQIREQPRSAAERAPIPPPVSFESRIPRRSARATSRPLFTPRTHTPPPIRSFHRRGGMSDVYIPEDTRRHGMILAEPEESIPQHPPESLPSYTPLPCSPFRRVTDDGRLESSPVDPVSIRARQSRQTELRQLQRQWNIRRHTHPVDATEPTHYRAQVAETYDLPPPYACRDPYPLFKPKERKASIWSRVALYPFVPQGPLYDKATFATDRLASKVAFGVKKGVENAGKKAKASRKQMECKRAQRKITWLEGRGYVDLDREREVVEERQQDACGVYTVY